MDVIRDEAEHSVMSMAGLDEEEDMFAPVLAAAKRRAVGAVELNATVFGSLVEVVRGLQKRGHDVTVIGR